MIDDPYKPWVEYGWRDRRGRWHVNTADGPRILRASPFLAPALRPRRSWLRRLLSYRASRWKANHG